jgi:hypothetical protein
MKDYGQIAAIGSTGGLVTFLTRLVYVFQRRIVDAALNENERLREENRRLRDEVDKLRLRNP